jgi:hypothetical protein
MRRHIFYTSPRQAAVVCFFFVGAAFFSSTTAAAGDSSTIASEGQRAQAESRTGPTTPPSLNLLNPTRCDSVERELPLRQEDVHIRNDATLNVMFHGNRFVAAEELVRGYEAENPGERLSWTTLPPKNSINAIKSIGRDPEVSASRFLPDVVLGPKALDTAILPLRDDGVHVVNKGKYSSVTGLVGIARSNDDRVRPSGGGHLLADTIARAGLRVVLPGYQERAQIFIKTIDALLGEGVLDQLSAAGRVDVSEIRHHRDIPARVRTGCSDLGIQFLQSKAYWELHAPGAFQFVDIPSSKSDLQLEDSYAFVVRPNPTSQLTTSAQKTRSADAFARFMFSPSAEVILRKYGLQPR